MSNNAINFYQKVSISTNIFSDNVIRISFPTRTVMLLNESETNTKVVEYSFNGHDLHGELDPTLPSRGLFFDNRNISRIWLRVKENSTGPIIVRVDAWGIP